ncbi:5-formyltetrahydrofolate cyclo-ligase [Nocardioides sp. GY 10113]|uniref:5-formyltetrahydrofolate cyclo-ligase n=1 Tax=Nocardioides sp. GY 10113 TaxID=2569761 RepID=UPI0010A9437B|nr:5-formyltetrahydrofolate cyclo-ligase [Nocardioides sp. GY 10113]TIC88238.1 5-formyltetrahydrofolate cyclo-ligase [Nocardioides sp. GY 10113]
MPEPTDQSDPTSPIQGPAPEVAERLRAAKSALRAAILDRRRAAPTQRDGAAIADAALASPAVRDAAAIACYVATAGEPDTGPLLDRLRAAGCRVLLPVLLPDNDLDWGVYEGADALRPGRFELLEPAGPRLGPDAIAAVDAVLVPGLAVSADGHRLGRGGGSYDRALTRLPAGAFTAVVLRRDEVGLDVPVEPHDRPVRAAITPDGVRLFPTADR